jgi:hypothetical protein
MSTPSNVPNPATLLRSHGMAAVLIVLAASCSSPTESLKEPLRVSISAANYSELSKDELYRDVSAPEDVHPVPPSISPPARLAFYVFLAKDYSKEIPLESIERELATPLAERGYFNVVYQMRAGHPASRIDYLLRLYCGRRNWLDPRVRADKVAWSDNDITSPGYGGSRSAYLLGMNSRWDSRVGMSSAEVANVAMELQVSQGGGIGMGPGMGSFSERLGSVQDLSDEEQGRNTYMIVIEAFRFEDVRDKKGAAPCAWTIYISAPFRQGLKLANVLRPMARAAVPYFGTTTHGPQVFDVTPLR